MVNSIKKISKIVSYFLTIIINRERVEDLSNPYISHISINQEKGKYNVYENQK